MPKVYRKWWSTCSMRFSSLIRISSFLCFFFLLQMNIECFNTTHNRIYWIGGQNATQIILLICKVLLFMFGCQFHLKHNRDRDDVLFYLSKIVKHVSSQPSYQRNHSEVRLLEMWIVWHYVLGVFSGRIEWFQRSWGHQIECLRWYFMLQREYKKMFYPFRPEIVDWGFFKSANKIIAKRTTAEKVWVFIKFWNRSMKINLEHY